MIQRSDLLVGAGVFVVVLLHAQLSDALQGGLGQVGGLLVSVISAVLAARLGFDYATGYAESTARRGRYRVREDQ